jgi:hypothetical protein
MIGPQDSSDLIHLQAGANLAAERGKLQGAPEPICGFSSGRFSANEMLFARHGVL